MGHPKYSIVTIFIQNVMFTPWVRPCLHIHPDNITFFLPLSIISHIKHSTPDHLTLKIYCRTNIFRNACLNTAYVNICKSRRRNLQKRKKKDRQQLKYQQSLEGYITFPWEWWVTATGSSYLCLH